MKLLLFFIAVLQMSDARMCEIERSVPADVGAFMVRYGTCEHWAGEEPYDAARRREIERNIRNLRCTRLSADEDRLRAFYFDKPDILTSMELAKEQIAWPDCKAREAAARKAAPKTAPR